MSDVYKVAVALQMSSNASAILGSLATHLIHAHHQVDKLNKGLNDTTSAMNRVKLAIGGGLAIAGGTAALAVVGKMVDKGNELVKIQQNMAQAGVKATEIQEAYAEAWKLTGKYTNVGAAEALKVINEGRAIFGSQHEATHHGEDFVRMISFLKSFNGGKHAGGSMEFEREAVAAIKSAEIAGKITPKEMAEHLKQLTAMRVQYGDQLKISQFLTAERAGGASLRNTSDEFRYGMFPALVQENGPGAGVMLMTAFNKIVAGTGNRTKSLEHMADIGLLKRDMLDYDKNGRVKGLKDPSAIMNNQDAALNFGDWVMKTLKPLLDKQLVGLTGKRRDIRESQLVAAMFPDRNAQKAIIEVIQQFTKFSKDAALMVQARKQLDRTDEKGYLDKSWEGQKQAFETQWTNFVEALGAPLVGVATENLKRVNEALSGWAQWAARPEMAGTVEAIGKGIAVLGASLTAGGSVALIAALGPAGWIATGIVGATAAFVAFHEPFEKWLKSVTGMGPALDAADAAFNKAALAFAEWVKAITPSAETMGTLAAKLITEITSWPGRLSTAITEMGTALVTALSDMFKSLISKLNPFTKTSFEGGDGFGGLIQKASFGGGSLGANDNYGSASGVARSLGRGSSGNITGPLAGAPFAGLRGDVRAYVRAAALARGIDPNVAERVINQESGFNPYRNNLTSREQSYGVMQLNTQGGLGAVALRQGLNPRDPSQWRKHIDFGLDVVKRDGWRQWYGARDVGISRWQGIGTVKPQAMPAEKTAPTAGPPPRQRESVHVHNLIVDGKKMAAVVSTHQAEKMRFPTRAGGMDTYGEWRPPGTPVMDAA